MSRESGFFGGFFEKTRSRAIHDPPGIAIMLGPTGNRTIGWWRSAVHQSPTGVLAATIKAAKVALAAAWPKGESEGSPFP
jgi:hypothetical protein